MLKESGCLCHIDSIWCKVYDWHFVESICLTISDLKFWTVLGGASGGREKEKQNLGRSLQRGQSNKTLF